jgi:hypothetical protein
VTPTPNADDEARAAAVRNFADIVRQRHRRINPCFMTGKGCVHTEHIDREWEERAKGSDKLVGFMVRPFRPNIESFFELCLERYLTKNYSTATCALSLEQADKIRRTGYIVCEKICRRVQTVDFLVVDVSAPNANVFYELGLAYGIKQKIIVIHQESSEFGRKVAKYLSPGGCHVYPYRDLNPIEGKDFDLAQFVWRKDEDVEAMTPAAPTILLISRQYGFLSNALGGAPVDAADGAAAESGSVIDRYLGSPDIKLDFETHMKAAIGVAIANISDRLSKKEIKPIPEPYTEIIDGLRSPDEVKKEAGFIEVRQQVDRAYCTLIHTGGDASEPLSYFWLGYCHANGKNVIPVTSVDQAYDEIKDLAFDIRALWHMTFIKASPTKFTDELQDTLEQMIVTDFSELSRKNFWDRMLDRRGRVSIFTGALHNNPIGRDMIGDWDLRAASELTSFFASHQYRATIESPVYQIEQVVKNGKQKNSQYYDALAKMLADKNCVIIASPDVNPLTEIILGKLYEIPPEKWFSDEDVSEVTGAVVAFKESEKKADHAPPQSRPEGEPAEVRTFYRQVDRRDIAEDELPDNVEEGKFRKEILDKVPEDDKAVFEQGYELDSAHKVYRIKEGTAKAVKVRMVGSLIQIGFFRLKRGFKGHGVPNQNISGEFLSQKDDNSPFKVHAHLVVAKNPFDGDGSDKHHIIILNGVSGPATFALTHVLTGGTSTQFVAYRADFVPDDKSEKFLQQVNKDVEMISREDTRGFQYFLEVEVGPPTDVNSIAKDIFDWRRILGWNRISDTPRTIYRQK